MLIQPTVCQEVIMTNAEQSTSNAAPTDGPLFQNQEAQEQVYSPQQVPGINIPPVERDTDGSAAQGSAVATDPDDDTTTALGDARRSYG
jgi:hypothetical protein